MSESDSKSIHLLDCITSIFHAGEFLEHWLKEITRQTLFPSTLHWLVDNNPDERDAVILHDFCAKHSNTRLLTIREPRTIYHCWNRAIRCGEAPLITFWSVDDARHPSYNELHVRVLDQNPEIALVFCDHFVTYKPNETWENNSSEGYLVDNRTPHPTRVSWDYDPKDLVEYNLPHCGPIWRRSLHVEVGMFGEFFTTAGDWEFFTRCALLQGKKMAKIVGMPLGLYYRNPRGLSTNTLRMECIEQEALYVKYRNRLAVAMKISVEGFASLYHPKIQIDVVESLSRKNPPPAPQVSI